MFEQQLPYLLRQRQSRSLTVVGSTSTLTYSCKKIRLEAQGFLLYLDETSTVNVLDGVWVVEGEHPWSNSDYFSILLMECSNRHFILGATQPPGPPEVSKRR